MAAYDEEHTFRQYYYLPSNLTMSAGKEGTPEFSFQTFTMENSGEIAGGILHFLLRWGLTKQQEQELGSIIGREVDSLCELHGAVMVTSRVSPSSWEITSNGNIGKILNRSLTSSGQAPSIPGGKIAFAFRLNAQDAKLIREALQNKDGFKGEKIRLFFHYRSVDRKGASKNQTEWVLEADIGELVKKVPRN